MGVGLPFVSSSRRLAGFTGMRTRLLVNNRLLAERKFCSSGPIDVLGLQGSS
jgi:hypothetical protein